MLLFVEKSRFINDSHYEFGKMCVVRITLSHPCLVKIHKNVTEQLTSNITLFRCRFSSHLGF